MPASLTVVDERYPWFAHMAIVAAVSYGLARWTRLKLVGAISGCGLGLAAMFGLSLIWFDARFYWHEAIKPALLGGLVREFPDGPGAFAFAWVVPALVAWGCTCRACPRPPIRPTDGSTD